MTRKQIPRRSKAKAPAKRHKPKAPSKKPPPKKPVGRPSGYQDAFAAQAGKLCELGAIDVDLADFFHVSVRTIARWQVEYPEFCQALKGGKNSTDDRVERSLYQRAIGYTFDAVKIFLPKDSVEPVLVPYREHCPPDVVACIFWLKNRRKDAWRDRQEHTGADGGPQIMEIRWKEPEAS